MRGFGIMSILSLLALSTSSALVYCWDGAQLSQLEQFEKQVLGKNDYSSAVDTRLEQVESRLFGRPQSGTTKHRLQAIEHKLDPSAPYEEEPPPQTKPVPKPAWTETAPQLKATRQLKLEPQVKVDKAQTTSGSTLPRESSPLQKSSPLREISPQRVLADPLPLIAPRGMSIDDPGFASKPILDPPFHRE